MSTRTTILKLLGDGAFHSGTEMGYVLGMSRAAVCKGVKRLADAGIDIHRVSGRGYRLETLVAPLDEARIRAELAIGGVSLPLEVLETVDSTNRYLMQRQGGNAICLAEAQHQGRGRRGRAWIATPYRNLLLSVAWRFPFGPAMVGGLSLAAGVAVVRALEDYGVTGVGLKWPNDVLWERRKIAGLLVDVQGEAAGPCDVVLGVGVNVAIAVRDGAAIDQPWVDMQSLLRVSVDRNRLAVLTIRRVVQMFQTFSEQGLEAFRADWQARHLYHGKRVRLINDTQEIRGTVEGIDAAGGLCLCDEHGHRQTFYSGEVSVRPL